MGVVGSKSAGKSPFLFCTTAGNTKVHGSHVEPSYGEVNENGKSEVERTAQYPRRVENASQASMKYSVTSLRTVHRCSIKPGRKFSLHYTRKESTLPDFLTSNVDEDDIISIHDLYNILNDGAMKPFIHDPYNILILDSRDLQYYVSSHVVTAKHHAQFMASSNLMINLSSYSMVVVYSNSLQNDRDTNELINLINDIKEYTVLDILVLKEGFDIFSTTYPFLCTEKTIDSIADRKLLVSYPSIILDHELYQGRGDQATNSQIVQVLNITHIVNITTEHKNAFPNKIKYLKLVLEDVSKTNLYEHFNKTCDFINNAICNGGRVLVHCNQGVSRSSTVSLAYLMKYKKWDLNFAFTTLKARRSCSCPNAGFFNQLSDWEEHIFGSRLTNIDSL